MLRSIKELFNYKLLGEDGEIGKCKDFLMDHLNWYLRYIVVDISRWITGKKILVVTDFLKHPDWESRTFPTSLTGKEIENMPSLDEDAPISRQYEKKYHQYFKLPYYGSEESAEDGTVTHHSSSDSRKQTNPIQTHLRSIKEIIGYKVRTDDGEAGHVEDFIMDDTKWIFRYVIVDAGKWLKRKNYLISVSWVEQINWAVTKIDVGLTIEAIENSPEFDPSTPVNREYETRLYDYYGRPYYW